MEAFYAQFLRPNELAFDVGAYHGSRTRAFRALRARVVAIEPVRESVRTLFARFHDDPMVTIVPRAVGAALGTAEIQMSAPGRFSSSINPEYPRAGMESGLYTARGVTSWGDARVVQVTTLDTLIAAFGVPAFTKVDVEGSEDMVLAGLSQPLPALSFEFHPHLIAPALNAIQLLRRFGQWRMNFAIEERFQWQLNDWVAADAMADILAQHSPRADFMYGDVYARFAATPHNGSAR